MARKIFPNRPEVYNLYQGPVWWQMDHSLQPGAGRVDQPDAAISIPDFLQVKMLGPAPFSKIFR